MLIINLKKSLYFSLFLLLSSCIINAQQNQSVKQDEIAEKGFRTHMRPFCVFKSFGRKSKSPVVQFFNPVSNEFTILSCGSRGDQSEEASYIARSTDLQKLTVLNSKVFSFEGGTLVQKKYPGSRESSIAKGFESILSFAGLMSATAYAGQPLFDELNAGAPLWWVTTLEDFTNIRIYLQKLLNGGTFKKGRIPLVLDLVDADPSMLSEDDLLFIADQFDLVDPDQEKSEIAAFFKSRIKDMGKMASKKASDFKEAKESWGERFLRLVESDERVEGFDPVKLSTKVAKYVILVPVAVNAIKPFQSFLEGKCDFKLWGEKKEDNNQLQGATRRS